MAASPIPARRLNHAVLFVSDLERSIRFWTSAFKMSVAAKVDKANAAFLRLDHGDNHHDLGLFGLGPSAERPGGRTVGLYHLAWQVDTIDELAEARQRLVDLDAYSGESSHGATKSIYAVDPDGNQFEVMWMLPRQSWGAYADAAPVETLDLDAELAAWSGVGTAKTVPVEAAEG